MVHHRFRICREHQVLVREEEKASGRHNIGRIRLPLPESGNHKMFKIKGPFRGVYNFDEGGAPGKRIEKDLIYNDIIYSRSTRKGKPDPFIIRGQGIAGAVIKCTAGNVQVIYLIFFQVASEVQVNRIIEGFYRVGIEGLLGPSA
jgi:hypothetical protein